MDGLGLKSIKWDDKKVRQSYFQIIDGEVKDNSGAHHKYLTDLRKACDSSVQILAGIAKQLEVKSNTQDFKISGAKSLRMENGVLSANSFWYITAPVELNNCKNTFCPAHPPT